MIEFSVNMANRPGQLATLARELGAAGVNIETLAAVSTGPDARYAFPDLEDTE